MISSGASAGCFDHDAAALGSIGKAVGKDELERQKQVLEQYCARQSWTCQFDFASNGHRKQAARFSSEAIIQVSQDDVGCLRNNAGSQ
ncbi:hypothetical protein AXE65_06715 [Ventosimonas gracilis]|uniref:Uncharacterized protein n=1 Tax=Ventosimonas gracilis TaxID=1680762 RepID=A0A139SK33_9GAMM|nr:hypothetical protein AXE65_06715 [Ventosimonas gracilis]